MKYCELSQALVNAMNGEVYDFYAERIERGYLAVNSGRVYFGEHTFRGNKKKHCLIVEVPTLPSFIRGNSHHKVWYYVKREVQDE